MRSFAHKILLVTCVLALLGNIGALASVSIVGPGSSLIGQGAAGMVTLAWNKSPDATVAGYYLYYGFNGADVTNRLDAAHQSFVTLSGLTTPGVYAFEVSAYDENGNESGRSNCIQYALPAPAQTLSMTSFDAREKTMVLSFPTVAGVPYRVEFSVDLVHWQTLTTIDNAQDGTLTVPLKIDSASVAGFYRLAHD